MPLSQLSDEQLLQLDKEVGGFIAPVSGKITSDFSDLRDDGARQHGSVDISATPDTPVVAPGNMKVLAYRQGGKRLRDNDWWLHGEDIDTGVKYKFAHIGDVSGLKEGQIIPRGQPFTVIGRAITNPHLHLQVKSPSGESIDWAGKAGLEKGSQVEQHGVLGKVLDWLGPSSAEAGQGVDLSKLSNEELLALQPTEKKAPLTDLSKLSNEELLALSETPVKKTGPKPAGQVELPTMGGFTTLRDPNLMAIAPKIETADTMKERALNFPIDVGAGLRHLIDLPYEKLGKPYVAEPIEQLLQSVSLNPEETKGTSELLASVAGTIATMPAYSLIGRLLGAMPGVGKAVPEFIERPIPGWKPSSEEAIAGVERVVTRAEAGVKLFKADNWDMWKEIQNLQSPAHPLFATPEGASRIENIKVALQSSGSRLGNVMAEKTSADAILNSMKAEAAMPPPTELVAVKKMYSGGPDSEAIMGAVKKDIGAGISFTQAIANAAKAYGSTPADIHAAIARASQLSAGSLGSAGQTSVRTATQTFDAINQPLAEVVGTEFKGRLPSVRDVGTDVPTPPNHPGGIDPRGSTNPTKNIHPVVADSVSPTILSGNVFGKNGPIHEWMGQWYKNLFEQAYYRRFLNNIHEKAGLMDDVKLASAARDEVMIPHEKELAQYLLPYQEAQSLLKQREVELARVATGSPRAQALVDEIGKLKVIKVPPEVTQTYAKAEASLKELEQQFATIRIGRALDGNKDSLALLKPNEQEVYNKLMSFHKQAKGLLTEQGVPTLEGSYLHHMYNWGASDVDKGLASFANRFWWQKEQTPPGILTFLSREKNAPNFYPLAYQATDAYISAFTRKLAFNPWYQKWSPAMATWENGPYQGVHTWLNNFLSRNMTPQATDWVSQLANGMVNFEYGHYLFGNFGPALLHLFKIAAIPAWHGFGSAGKGLVQYGEALGGKVMGGVPNAAQRAVEYYAMSPQLIQSLEQSPAWAGTFQPSFWQRLRGNPILNPTRLTEHMGRGINALASINEGEKIGASAKAIHDATIDAIAKLDFFGWDAPPIIAKHRMLAQFQMQPQKLLERNAQLIRDALMGEKDYYGNSHWPKLVRLAVTLGMLYEAGDMMGFDLSKHTIAHIPFFPELGHDILRSVESGESKVSAKSFIPAIPPTIGLVAGLADQGSEGTLRKYLSYGGTPQKFLQERIPSRYGEDRAQWLMGVPKAGYRSEEEEKTTAFEARRLKQQLRRQGRTSEDVTPYNLLLDLIGGD